MKKKVLVLLLTLFVITTCELSSLENINTINNIYGYKVRKVEQTQDNALKGIIEIHGKKYSFEDLNFSQDTGLVTNQVTLQDSAKKSVLEKDTSGYGKKITFRNLKITPDGILAEAYVPVPNEKDENYSLKFDSVKLNSDGSVVTKKKLSKKIVYGTYKINAEQIYFDGSKISVENGKIETASDSFDCGDRIFLYVKEDLPLNDFSFNYNEMLTECNVKKETLSFTVDDWLFVFNKELLLTSEGLQGDCSVYQDTENYSFHLQFPKFILKSDKTIISGKTGEEENSFIKNKMQYTLNDAYFVKKNKKLIVKAEKPELAITTSDRYLIYFGKTVIDSNGKILFSETKKQPEGIKFYSKNDYLVEPNKAKITNKGVKMSGTVYDEILNLKKTFNSRNLVLTSDFVVKLKKYESFSFAYNYRGWKIHGSDIQKIPYPHQEIPYRKIIESNKVKFRGQTIDLGRLEFDTFLGCLTENAHVEQNVPVSLLNSDYTKFDSVIGYTVFTDKYEEKLMANVAVTLPEPLEKCTIDFYGVYLNPDGTFYYPDTLRRAYFNITDNFHGELQDIVLDSVFGIYARRLLLTLPPVNEGSESATIEIEYVKVREEDDKLKVNIEGGVMAPIALENVTFHFLKIKAENDGYVLNGITTVPIESSYDMMKLDYFRISHDGEIENIECKSDSSFYNLPYDDGYLFNVSKPSLHIEENGSRKEFVLSFENASLNFPSYFRTNSIKVKNVKYNVSNQKWDISEMISESNNENEILEIMDLTQRFIREEKWKDDR